MKVIEVGSLVTALRAVTIDDETGNKTKVGNTYTVVAVDTSDNELPYRLNIDAPSSEDVKQAVNDGWASDLGCGWVPVDAIALV